MKKILLNVLMGISLQAFAFIPPGFSSLEILSGNGNFTASLDGYTIESRGHFAAFVNIQPGYHQLDIYKKQKCNHPYHNGYCKAGKIFSSQLYLQPSMVLRGYIDNQGRLSIAPVNAVNGYSVPAYVPAPVTILPENFSVLQKTIHAQYYEDAKLAIARQALQSNYFLSSQVAELMGEFWYESTKLEFAKAAYSKVIDPQNYYVVNTQFWYSSSVVELSDYILSYRR